LVQIIRTDSNHDDFRLLVSKLDDELRVRDGEEHSFYSQFNKLDKIRYVLVAYVDETAVGCGAIREYSKEEIEIKRMFIKPEYRGQGIASHILSLLEAWAQELDYKACILETGFNQPEAIQLYKKSGYLIIPNYGPYVGVANSVCMRKTISG
jgi:putative acetyltransferase